MCQKHKITSAFNSINNTIILKNKKIYMDMYIYLTPNVTISLVI